MLSPSLSLTFSELTFSESIIIFRCFANQVLRPFGAALAVVLRPMQQPSVRAKFCVATRRRRPEAVERGHTSRVRGPRQRAAIGILGPRLS